MASGIGLQQGTSSTAIPLTQNTAPVLEFNCLYTHDLRRKQKRWQDGFLRFHTFNKRIMVFDVPRNFIGDTHWSGDAELQEGDELSLDKGSALVQVSEIIGRTATDISELRRSAKKPLLPSPKGEYRESPLPRFNCRSVAPESSLQQRHTSLKTLLGRSRAPMGRAVLPTMSRFDLRQANKEVREFPESDKPQKRRRMVPADQTPVMRAKSTISEQQTAERAKKTSASSPLAGHGSKRRVADRSDTSVDKDCILLDYSSDVNNESSPVREIAARFKSPTKQPHLPVKPVVAEDVAPRTLLKVNHKATRRKMLLCTVETDTHDPSRASSATAMRGLRVEPGSISYSEKQAERLRARLDRVQNKKSQPIARVSIAAACSDPDSRAVTSHVYELRMDESNADFLGKQEDSIREKRLIQDPAEDRAALPSQERARTDDDVMMATTVQDRQATPQQIPTRPLHLITEGSSSTVSTESGPPNSRLPFQRPKGPVVSAPHLDVSAGSTARVLLNKPFQRPQVAKKDVESAMISEPDPWSREAFDLFSWRPPGWSEKEWRIETQATGNEI